jgi:hypothetical protein
MPAAVSISLERMRLTPGQRTFRPTGCAPRLLLLSVWRVPVKKMVDR